MYLSTLAIAIAVLARSASGQADANTGGRGIRAGDAFVPVRLIQAQNEEQQRAISSVIEELQRISPQLFQNINMPGSDNERFAIALPNQMPPRPTMPSEAESTNIQRDMEPKQAPPPLSPTPDVVLETATAAGAVPNDTPAPEAPLTPAPTPQVEPTPESSTNVDSVLAANALFEEQNKSTRFPFGLHHSASESTEDSSHHKTHGPETSSKEETDGSSLSDSASESSETDDENDSEDLDASESEDLDGLDDISASGKLAMSLVVIGLLGGVSAFY